jgi:syntaxin 5
MPLQDRTNEFRTCVDSTRSRSGPSGRGAEQKQRLLQQRRTGPKSEFTQMATAIGKDISSVSLKLNKLGQCAWSPSLYPPLD